MECVHYDHSHNRTATVYQKPNEGIFAYPTSHSYILIFVSYYILYAYDAYTHTHIYKIIVF